MKLNTSSVINLVSSLTDTLKRCLGAVGFLLVALAAAIPLPGYAQNRVPVSAFAGQTHIHGLAVDLQNPEDLLIATHHGLFKAGPDAIAERISVVQDFMGFSPHPSDPLLFFASGHPDEGGNLGFIVSTDGGRTWIQRSLGLNGPVDFHQMTISPADPNVIYGAFGSLQVSTDAGMSWTIAGPLPEQIVDLAASAIDPDTLFAAAVDGLFVSHDAGTSWTSLVSRAPVSLVEVAPDGSLYAFVVGEGLMRAANEREPLVPVDSTWITPNLFHLSVDPTDPSRLFAATAAGRVVISTDQGRNWTYFGG